MPASSLNFLHSWGLYLISSAVLVLVLTPQLNSLAHDSREGADWRDVDGIKAVVDSLRPGVIVHLNFGKATSDDPVRLSGHQISCLQGNGTITLPSRWLLSDYTLLPDHHYIVWLSGGMVQVRDNG